MSKYNDCPCGESELGCNCPEVRTCLEGVLGEPAGILVDADQTMPALVNNKFDFYEHFRNVCVAGVLIGDVVSYRKFSTSKNNA
jgi:hypothetical protein